MQTQPAFTAHNILLNDGTQTLPAAGFFMCDHIWFLAAKAMLKALFPQSLAGVRIVDLGCLEGGYTVEFARLGMNATGIEVRKSNFENCLYIKERTSLPNLHFANDDVWNVEQYGEFDAAFCCGLLYHLDRPKEFISMLGRTTRKIVMIQTHFATENEIEGHNLSEMTLNEGVPGRWFGEHNEDDREALEKLKWAAWSNKRSFWIQREYLLQTIRDAGFNVVLEQYDALGYEIATEMIMGSYKKSNRGMFVGIKT